MQYISSQYGLPYVVQPLPVEALSTHFAGEGKVAVSWSPVIDSLEVTAAPTGYVVYTRIDDGGFDNGRYTAVSYTHLTSFSPTMPRSATPIATACGMSSSRR